MDLLLKVVMTAYVIVGVLVIFAMLGNVIFWKSEKVYNIQLYYYYWNFGLVVLMYALANKN